MPSSPAQRGLFITGTDTGIGKTVVAAVLTLALEAAYWKPIQAGDAPSTDRADMARWTGLPPERLLPERHLFSLPASPHLAAARAGRQIEVNTIQLPACDRLLVVEGAGGVLAPLSATTFMADLMVHFGLPVVLVARTQLGTLNHTLLSLEALRRRGLEVSTVVLHGEPHPENAQAIAGMGHVTVQHLPWLPTLDPITLQQAAPPFTAARARLLGGAV